MFARFCCALLNFFPWCTAGKSHKKWQSVMSAKLQNNSGLVAVVGVVVVVVAVAVVRLILLIGL